MEINIEGKSLVIRLDNPCERCGSYTYEIRYKKPHVGLYCKCCGKYIKWLSKEEKKKYGIVTPEDFKSDEIDTKYVFIDDVINKEKTITQKIVDAQLLKDEVNREKHHQDYSDGLNEEVPW